MVLLLLPFIIKMVSILRLVVGLLGTLLFLRALHFLRMRELVMLLLRQLGRILSMCGDRVVLSVAPYVR